MIFKDYLAGIGTECIAKKLNALGIPAYHNGTWNGAVIRALITNEKLTGDSWLQKWYVTDHLSKKLVVNRGKLPKYYSEGTHPAIIDKETFDNASSIMEAQRIKYNSSRNPPVRYPFTGKIHCENCGKQYKRIVVAGRVAWQCSTCHRYGKDACHAKKIPDSILLSVTAEVLGQEAFDETLFNVKIDMIRVPAFNRLVFIFKDGRQVERIWEDHSRRDSWTPEMKERARHKALERNALL